jgi:hypothetical protein
MISLMVRGLIRAQGWWGGSERRKKKKPSRSALETANIIKFINFFVAALEEFKFLMEIQPAGARHMSAA